MWGDSLGWKTKLAEVEDRIEANAAITDELSAMGLEQAQKEGIPMGLRGKARGQDGRVVEVRHCPHLNQRPTDSVSTGPEALRARLERRGQE